MFLINTGDLLHGNSNEVAVIPLSIASQVAAAAAQVRAREAQQTASINSPEFNIEGLHHWRLSHLFVWLDISPALRSDYLRKVDGPDSIWLPYLHPVYTHPVRSRALPRFQL